MGMGALGFILKGTGAQFFSYIIPRIKNSKVIRDIRKRWVKDNYALKTKLIFEASVVDSKNAMDLPDELIIDLLKDPLNRDEIFRWILEGTSIEQFDHTRLNLEPYMESYSDYQDFLRPFFEMVLVSLHDYKEIHWEPEFLEILHQIGELEEVTKTGFLNIETKQTRTIQLLEDANLMLKEVITPTEFEDLNQLLELEKVNSAREKAKERLQNNHLKSNEILELNAIIANSYIISGQEAKAISYLYACISSCNDKARKKRLRALINLIEKRLDPALEEIKGAIEIEGYSEKNIEILVNIYLQQRKYIDALKVLNDYPEKDLPKLKAYVLVSLKRFDEVIELTDSYLQNNPDNINWLIIKAESLVLKTEYDIERNITIDPSKSLETVMPLLNKLDTKDIDNIGILMRIKEIKAALLFRNKDYAEAKILYEEVYRSNSENSNLCLKNLLLSCYGDQDWGKAIILLEEKISLHPHEIDDVTSLAKMYAEAGKTEKAIDLLESNKSYFDVKNKLALDYYFTYIDALILELRHSEINKMLSSLADATNDLTGLHVLKGYYALKKHDWENSIYHFESSIDLLDGDDLVETKVLLSHAYSNVATLESYKKLKELLITIPHWAQHDFLINRYTNALFELGEYEKIISLSKQLPEKTVFLLDRIATIYFNLGWYEIAKINYRTLHQSTRELSYQLRYASCLFSLGNIEECLEVLTAAESRVKKSGKVEELSLLSSAFMNARQYRKSLEYAYQTYLVGKENPQAWRFFFWQMSYLSRFVENAEKDWIKEYQIMFNQFNQEFPDEEPLGKEVEAIKDGEISPELIEEIKRGSEFSQEMKNLFKTHKLSISMLVALLDRGPFETWGHIMNEQSTDLWISHGSYQELIDGRLSAKQAKEVVCDISTLLTLRHLGLLDELVKYYKLYIHQRQFDAIFNEYSRNKLINEEGLKIAIYHEGQILIQEISSEEVKNSVIIQEEFIKWINQNCEKLGSVISNEQKSDPRKEKLLFFTEPMEICKEKLYSMLVDSSTLKAYAKESYNVNCFTTLDLLKSLVSRGEIAKDRESELLGKLMLTGHTLIPVDKEVFMFFLKKNNFKLNLEVLAIFDYLRKAEFNKGFLVNLMADLLSWIWIEDISAYERQQLTDYICLVLTAGKRKDELISALITESNSKFSFLVEHQWLKMKICIEQWFQAQSIV
ncbi:hypothetical protein R7236_25685 [Priestia megaterium]|uniref:tetratricopeptide repeat protein n=1 Tax=Priestia megaterium TaxID=1404 RepID=UPI00296F5E42|nr:hypothetical protein [Priestia megaterium]MDW4511786.1 hypothetical protein [Priestia megaterium]